MIEIKIKDNNYSNNDDDNGLETKFLRDPISNEDTRIWWPMWYSIKEKKEVVALINLHGKNNSKETF